MLLVLLAPPLAAAEPAPAPATPSAAEIQALVARIQDPAERDRLVADLNTLAAAQNARQAKEQPALLDELSDHLQEAGDEVLAVLSALGDLGHLPRWASTQFEDEGRRALWGEVFAKLAILLFCGVAAEQLLALLLRRPRRLIASGMPANRWLRIPSLLMLWLLDLLPIVAFILTVHGLRGAPILILSEDTKLATRLITAAYVLSRVALVCLKAVLQPDDDAIRLPALDGETAGYLTIWARRLALTGIWGHFLIQALYLLGLPESGRSFLFKLLGLLIATLSVIFILQNRQAVAGWIRTGGRDQAESGPFGLARRRMAEIWHVLAVLYVVATYVVWALKVKGGFEYILKASLLTLVILAAASILGALASRTIERAFSVNEEWRERFPHLEVRANRYLAVMHAVVRAAIALVGLLAMAAAWGANMIGWLTSDLGRRVIAGGLTILVVLAGAVIVWELLNSAIERYLGQTDEDGNAVARSARMRTLLPLLRNAALVVLVILVVLIVLSELGVDIAPLLAGAGVVGVAIGFGSQKLVQDVITGAFILFEDTLAIGDSVKIGSYAGTVEGLTIRTIRLRDGNGDLHTLPFSAVGNVTNQSRDFGCHVFNVSVAYDEDPGRVIKAIQDVGSDLAADPELGSVITESLQVFGIDHVTALAFVIQGQVKTLPGAQFAVARAFNRLLKARFDLLGIRTPATSSVALLSKPPAR